MTLSRLKSTLEVQGSWGKTSTAAPVIFLLFQSGGQGFFVDQAAAGGIDDAGSRFHHGQFFGADHFFGLGIQRNMQGDKISFFVDSFQRYNFNLQIAGTS